MLKPINIFVIHGGQKNDLETLGHIRYLDGIENYANYLVSYKDEEGK